MQILLWVDDSGVIAHSGRRRVTFDHLHRRLIPSDSAHLSSASVFVFSLFVFLSIAVSSFIIARFSSANSSSETSDLLHVFELHKHAGGRLPPIGLDLVRVCGGREGNEP